MDNLKQVINHLDYETQLDKARVLIELRRLEIKRRKNDWCNVKQSNRGYVDCRIIKQKKRKEVPLFMGKSILLPNGQQQLLAILPNIQILTTVEQEEEWIV